MKKVLMSIMLLSACGVELRHSGEATVNHIVKLDPVELISGFETYCEALEVVDIDGCVDKELGEFFRLIAESVDNVE